MDKFDELWHFTKTHYQKLQQKASPLVKSAVQKTSAWTHEFVDKCHQLADFKGRQRALYETWDQEAQQGNKEAAYKLLMLYFDETEEYYPLAFKWAYALAHEGKDCGVMLQLAKMYEEGHGTEKDLSHALTWYERCLTLHIIRGKKSPLSVDSANYVQVRIQALRSMQTN